MLVCSICGLVLPWVVFALMEGLAGRIVLTVMRSAELERVSSKLTKDL
jgi:hypothetical protein